MSTQNNKLNPLVANLFCQSTIDLWYTTIENLQDLCTTLNIQERDIKTQIRLILQQMYKSLFIGHAAVFESALDVISSPQQFYHSIDSRLGRIRELFRES